ncbi:SDR family oxidoreductase [Castellaniella sp.]|uniref:SDR family oxidoreductase n=1 Tax=Castellaniella sp. TaxID=1955812 RepID=UPI00356004EF
MDLYLQGKVALVCGASQGLGFACARALALEGAVVTLVARRGDVLAKAAERIREDGAVDVRTVAADITTAAGRDAALVTSGAPDILVTNAGGPKPGDFREWTRDDWMSALDNNMYSPIALMQSVIDPMIERRFGRIVNITSSAVKMPIDILGLSNGARSGLTGFVAGLARQVAQYGITINNLLPGAFSTVRLQETARRVAEDTGVSLDEVQQGRLMAIPARRFGDPAEFGDACAFLCSPRAGYITGQNLLLDGGAFPGTL